ncbi:hydratase [Kaistia algarum]|uniref:2-keto-4-pentenoate hydratase n=1 Tax=Kaistia algarum TaxID=2083279 RepID=UPI000CE8658F|nr:fumarylacetoacetate hydrolase family protein [Kaistia algarum]MCX5513463.1 fumarylacetoacetate hydrolase family protein [Kaistia algarum]PPE77441.1 hydratase [Kaistia algarum]
MPGKDAAEALAAERLADARLGQRMVEVLPFELRPSELTSAYRIQDRVHERLATTHFRRRIGWKIGCTTPVMQTYLGIPSPCAAGLFAGTRHASGVHLQPSDFRRVGIECEIGVRFGEDVSPEAASDPARIAASIREVFAAIEIVDDRYADWRNTDTPTLVADDFFAAGCVLGHAVPAGTIGDLAGLAGATFVNGAEVGRGIGADVLGHPLNALAFLAGNLAERGIDLRAGDIVLTGSLVETRWLNPGDDARIEIGGLGSVQILLGEAPAP